MFAEVGATYKKYVEGNRVAAMVAFLAGPDSDYVTGQALITDGGLVFR